MQSSRLRSAAAFPLVASAMRAPGSAGRIARLRWPGRRCAEAATTIAACVQGLLAWLNCVPNWSADCGLPAGQKQALVNAMALGALAAVLKQPGDDACGVPLWPAAAARQH